MPGPLQIFEPIPPVPTIGIPGSTSASARNSSSVYDSPFHSSRRNPSTATSPVSSQRLASAVRRTTSASGAAPPYWPECLLLASVRASTVMRASPRSETVSEGWPARIEPPSATRIASAAKSSGCSDGYPSSSTLPTSSCPSRRIFTPTGGRPPQARSAPTWTRRFDFESAAPRP